MDNSLKTKLLQLECHFTWDFKKEDTSIADLEERLHEEIQFSQKKYKGSSYNYLAYVKHMQGLNKEALTFLEQAEEITRKDHGDEFEKLVIVTYGNFAWVYYHMGELTKTQSYLEKLEDICKKFPNKASRYSVLLPAVYGEKGLSFLKLAEQALKMSPDNPQVFRYVATLYRKQKSFDKSLELLTEALKNLPNSRFLNYQIALCYKSKALILKRQGDHYQKNRHICQLSRQYIFHLEKVAQSNPSFVYPQIDLAEMYAEYENIQKAEELFQILFSLTTITPEERQTLHRRYGIFQLQYNNQSRGL
ncbi:interferon-induced protein with tetratricopeptide repeats 1-like [Polyodon spathula]|uniref:interferon-induced protein with tetratricopeptide repeats 1-like n=1 Tax=Polyodon spathula TaxID=7913 RepID=UPI001B7E2C4B|nr:interferon-induced protein with tetratricopeptide repeats 1-like [Polyodon spathula]